MNITFVDDSKMQIYYLELILEAVVVDRCAIVFLAAGVIKLFWGTTFVRLVSVLDASLGISN